jgi:hypothetical protein
VAPPRQLAAIQRIREALALYYDSQGLIQLGAYAEGSNPKLMHPLPPGDPEFSEAGSAIFSPLPETLERLEKLAAALG